MNFAIIDAGLVVKLLLLLLLLIGMGPKVALVPFLEKTQHFDAETQRAVGRRMVVTAVVTALVLLATGSLLMRLLHVSGGAIAVGGAIVLAILAIKMASGPTKKVKELDDVPEDPKQIAVHPLAVPYLLNPVGITIIIIASGEIVSVASAGLVLGLILLVGAVDYSPYTYPRMAKILKQVPTGDLHQLYKECDTARNFGGLLKWKLAAKL